MKWKDAQKPLRGLQNFESTLNFIIIMEARTSLLSEGSEVGEATFQFLCFLPVFGKPQKFLPWVYTGGWGRPVHKAAGWAAILTISLVLLELESLQNKDQCPGAKTQRGEKVIGWPDSGKFDLVTGIKFKKKQTNKKKVKNKSINITKAN